MQRARGLNVLSIVHVCMVGVGNEKVSQTIPNLDLRVRNSSITKQSLSSHVILGFYSRVDTPFQRLPSSFGLQYELMNSSSDLVRTTISAQDLCWDPYTFQEISFKFSICNLGGSTFLSRSLPLGVKLYRRLDFQTFKGRLLDGKK